MAVDKKVNELSVLPQMADTQLLIIADPATGKLFQATVSALKNHLGVSTTVFSANIPVKLTGGKTLGKYANGTTIPAINKTAEQVLKEIAYEVSPPVYTLPVASININQDSSTLEVGDQVDVAITTGLTQNDGGNATGISVRKNGNQIAIGNTVDQMVQVSETPIVYQAVISYGQGPIKNNSEGQPDATGRIAAGSVSSNQVSLRGYPRIFFGPAPARPTDTTAVRNLPRRRFTNAGNVFLLDTGTVDRIFVIAFPATMTLQSVIDLDALGINITSSFQIDAFDVSNAGGVARPYKIAIMENAGPYSSPHFFQITLQ